MKQGKQILTYNEVLESIKNQENHLLIGNGFNRGLGINTSYKSIFDNMIETKRSLYSEAKSLVEECDYDLETFIGKLEGSIDPNNSFLRKYVRNKVKVDFMQAVHDIVKAEIKSVYAGKNEGIYLLLQNFTNYFSLNYDSLLYLLLLKFKTVQNNVDTALAFQSSIKFMEENMNEKQNNIYQEIKDARLRGEIKINVGDESNSINKPLRTAKKNLFVAAVKEYSTANKKGWKTKDINRVIKNIFDEEGDNRVLTHIDDGSKQQRIFGDDYEYVYDTKSKTQNLFFLHGAFQIYRDGKKIKKITQQSDKALYERLEEILNNEEQDIVCVFQHVDKLDVIKQNEYLRNCYNKLSLLSGNMVIIGSSLADNDNHIFDMIDKSHIDTVYISTLSKELDNISQLAIEKFPSKKIFIFDAESISYEKPNTVIKD